MFHRIQYAPNKHQFLKDNMQPFFIRSYNSLDGFSSWLLNFISFMSFILSRSPHSSFFCGCSYIFSVSESLISITFIIVGFVLCMRVVTLNLLLFFVCHFISLDLFHFGFHFGFSEFLISSHLFCLFERGRSCSCS
jgi:hypothetical protein